MIRRIVYFVFILMILSSCQGDNLTPLLPDPIDITSGLQPYFPFSGKANDVSGNGFNSTVFGNVILSTDRRIILSIDMQKHAE